MLLILVSFSLSLLGVFLVDVWFCFSLDSRVFQTEDTAGDDVVLCILKNFRLFGGKKERDRGERAGCLISRVVLCVTELLNIFVEFSSLEDFFMAWPAMTLRKRSNKIKLGLFRTGSIGSMDIWSCQQESQLLALPGSVMTSLSFLL